MTYETPHDKSCENSNCRSLLTMFCEPWIGLKVEAHFVALIIYYINEPIVSGLKLEHILHQKDSSTRIKKVCMYLIPFDMKFKFSKCKFRKKLIHEHFSWTKR